MNENIDIDPTSHPDYHKLIKSAYVVDRFRLMALLTPKTGRTTWQYILWNNSLTGSDTGLWRDPAVVRKVWQTPVLEKQGVRLVYNYHNDTTDLDSYYKLLSVRHPFSRLESVYLNKLFRGNLYYERQWGIEILSRYRKRTKNNAHDYSRGKGVTFEEFLKFVIFDPEFDAHYMPLSLAAHPCLIHYE